MSPFYTECDSKLVRQRAFWIPSLLLITIWNLHPFEERIKHFFQEVLHSPKFWWYQDSGAEHILPLSAPAKRLRYGRHIKTSN